MLYLRLELVAHLLLNQVALVSSLVFYGCILTVVTSYRLKLLRARLFLEFLFRVV